MSNDLTASGMDDSAFLRKQDLPGDLAAVAAKALALREEADRQIQEVAWEVGNRAGQSYVRRSWSDEPNAPEPVNPFSKGE